MNFDRHVRASLTVFAVSAMLTGCGSSSTTDNQTEKRPIPASAQPAKKAARAPSARSVPAVLGEDRAGIEPSVKSVKSGGPGMFEITYEWKIAREFEQDWRVFVHFTDGDGVNIFQNDHDPIPTTTQWVPGKLRLGPNQVKFPEGLSGTFEIRMGLFEMDRGDGVPRGRATLDGNGDGEKRIIVGKITIVDGEVEYLPVK
jgi:hypothetical protein